MADGYEAVYANLVPTAPLPETSRLVAAALNGAKL